MCAGLADIHAAGIVHLDFKPTNVLLSAEGDIRIAVWTQLQVAFDDGNGDGNGNGNENLGSIAAELRRHSGIHGAGGPSTCFDWQRLPTAWL